MSNDYYRSTNGATEATQVFKTPVDDTQVNAAQLGASAAQDDLAAQRAQEKAERDRQLGTVRRTDQPEPVAPVVHKPTTDKFMASLGLFLLRLVTAAIMGIHGIQKLTDIPATQDFLTSLDIPSPHLAAWGSGIIEVLIAVALFFGLATRLAGLGVAAIAILALVLVKWAALANPFKAGVPGFVGELELLLAGVGLALFFLGSGRWGIDGQMRSNRRRAKLAR